MLFHLCSISHFQNNVFQLLSNCGWHKKNHITGIIMPNHSTFVTLKWKETVMQNGTTLTADKHCHLCLHLHCSGIIHTWPVCSDISYVNNNYLYMKVTITVHSTNITLLSQHFSQKQYSGNNVGQFFETLWENDTYSNNRDFTVHQIKK